MLRIARTNFSEGYKALVHLKVVRLFVESVLVYGLPANFTGVIVKVRLSSPLLTLLLNLNSSKRLTWDSIVSYSITTSQSLQPDPKTSKRVLSTLTTAFAYLSNDKKKKVSSSKAKKEDAGKTEVSGEYVTLMEQEVFDFVLFEVPNVVS